MEDRKEEQKATEKSGTDREQEIRNQNPCWAEAAAGFLPRFEEED